MRIYVSGSLAYDRIMDFPGRFSDHIMPDKIHALNVSFTVNSMVERPGGTAGNIAYALALLGEEPMVLATIGHDAQPYFERLEGNGISREGIRLIETEPTASAYITTDLADNQITGFLPGAMKYTSEYAFNGADTHESVAIVAPGNLEDMVAYSREYKVRGIDYIFDPGQSLPAWTPKELRECITGARIVIANDYEMGLISNITGLDTTGLLVLASAVITTKAEAGSTVYTEEGALSIPVVPPKLVVDPTGAGDAYRGGLIKGLIAGKDLGEAALMGSTCASFAVEVHGTQEYRFTLGEFQERLASVVLP